VTEPSDVSLPVNRMVIAVLSLIGFFVAFYLLAHHLGWVGSLICGVGDCAAVQASPWSSVGPVPTAAIGLAGYVALLGVSIAGLQPAHLESRWVSRSLLAMASVALAYSVFLTYLEAFVIHAWCQWCVTSAILVVLIFAASLKEAPRLLSGRLG
jgi:uncharacterized membrane protein